MVFSIQASRGSDVPSELLGRDFNGVLGCDCFSAYRKFMGQMRGSVPFCFAHLIRDLKFLAEQPEPVMQIYAQRILRAVRRMFHLIHEQGQGPAPRADFQARLEGCKKRMIALAVDTKRLSSRDYYVERHYPEAFNMAARFRQHGDAYFTFITTPQIGPHPGVPPDSLAFRGSAVEPPPQARSNRIQNGHFTPGRVRFGQRLPQRKVVRRLDPMHVIRRAGVGVGVRQARGWRRSGDLRDAR